MNNFREVNNDILKDWLEFREQETFCNASPQDKEHYIYFEELSANILKNVPKENKKYVQKQLDKMSIILWIILIIGMRNIIGMGFVMG